MLIGVRLFAGASGITYGLAPDSEKKDGKERQSTIVYWCAPQLRYGRGGGELKLANVQKARAVRPNVML